MWQRHWDGRGRDYRMLAVAQDVRGAEIVEPIARERGATFPVLLDRTSRLARELGFQIVPSGFFVEPDGAIAYRHVESFDIGDPRVRTNLAAFLDGGELQPVDQSDGMNREALDLFAEGVSAYSAQRVDEALRTWRRALALDPDNFLIRSQIWAVEHPEHFWPVVDREWQELQLMKEGYDKPLP